MIQDKNHFQEHGTQNYLAFQPMYKYFEKIGNTDNISERKSKGLAVKVIKTPEKTLDPELIYSGKRMCSKFNGSCLKKDKITCNHGKIVNLYILYTLNSTLNYDEDIT